MNSRQTIGLIFSVSEQWIGGTYYIINLVHALGTLPDAQQPHLVIYTRNEENFQKIKATGYEHLTFRPLVLNQPFLTRAVNKVWRSIAGKPMIDNRPSPNECSTVFPLFHPDFSFDRIPRQFYWIPDFQERYLPEFFTNEEVLQRDQQRTQLAAGKHPIVFSSQSAQDDFHRFYPDSKAKTYVLRFAVTHPTYKDIDPVKLFAKFEIQPPYFITPNQFWAHKNHKTLLEALKVLKHKGIRPNLVLTGKEEDYRNPSYFNELVLFVEENGLREQVRSLGFIDRREQLQLMHHAHAVIQPSLFEGWSTVVEDAKAMNQVVIASNLAVHQEQLPGSALFFDPKDAKALAALMSAVWQSKPERPVVDYSQNVRSFGETFLRIVK